MPAPRWNPGRHRRGTIVTSSETGESLWPSGACPLPRDSDGRQVTLAHGEGGRETRRLIENCIWKLLPRTRYSGQGGDAARLPRPDGALAFTTDSYVVTPLFFPGGDIGELAVYGTVNDLAVMGAVPLWLSLAFIVEEGFPMSDLEAILQSIAAAATRTEVEIVTGDTKVVPRGAADGIYLNTSGVGVFVEPIPPGPDQIQPGDMLVVSGPIGRHGLAILAARENLGFEPAPLSDCAPVTDLFRAVRSAGVQYRAARDATRGGVAAVCQEWARASRTTFCLRESALPLSDEVRGASELLGLDPLFLANEGNVTWAVPHKHLTELLRVLHGTDLGRQAAVIGEVRPHQSVSVVVAGRLGRERVLEEPSGVPLPRIC